MTEGLRFVPDLTKEYALGKTLGRGKNGKVYLARRLSDKQLVALKVFFNVSNADDLKAEFDVMKRLSSQESGCHIGVVCYYDLFSVEGSKVCLVMQYVSGPDLYSLFKQTPRGLGANEMTKLIKHLLVTVDYIHSQGAAHLDIKPENIVMDGDKFYLIDFEFACMQMMKKCLPRGTLGFISPDLYAIRNGALDYTTYPFEGYVKADIWSLGVTFLELSTGSDFDSLWGPEEKEKFSRDVFNAIAKHDSSELPELPASIFSRAFKTVNPKIAGIIRSMLRVDYKKRPSARDLSSML